MYNQNNIKITALSAEGFQKFDDTLKPSQNKKKPKKILAAPKMMSFSQLPAVKKDTIFGAARKFFGPSYFMMALTYQKL